MQTDVLVPSSPGEAIGLFGDGTGVTVIGGGTIVMPGLNAGERRPAKALLLQRAGLAGVSRQGATISIGAATRLQELLDLPAPVGPCAANIADIEIRGQATVGGNLCAGAGAEAPRGDLQGALLAVNATARSAGSDGIVEEPLDSFLAHRAGRLLLSVSFDEPAAGAFHALDRAHTHDYTALAVSGARSTDGTTRLAVTGAGSHGTRLTSAEAAAANPEAAGKAALSDVHPHDDALASAWYRGRVLPVLVQRVLADLEGQA